MLYLFYSTFRVILMHCKNCGATVEPFSKKCEKCGNDVITVTTYDTNKDPGQKIDNSNESKITEQTKLHKRNWASILSLICAILGIPFLSFVIMSILAVFLGSISIRSDYKSLSKAAIIIGVIELLALFIIFICILLNFNSIRTQVEQLFNSFSLS